MEQVKEALWGWSSRDRRGDRRRSSLEVEDGAAEPAGRRDGLLRLEVALVFPEEEGVMQQSSVSISLSF